MRHYLVRLFISQSQYEERENGVVYPTVELDLKLTSTDEVARSEDDVCSSVTATDTRCSVSLPRGVYNVTLTQSNEIGSTVNSSLFDSECYLCHGYISHSYLWMLRVNLYCYFFNSTNSDCRR